MHVFKPFTPRCKSPDLDAAKHRNQNIRLSFRTTGHVGEAKRIEIGLTIGIDTCLWSLLSWLTAKHQTTAQVPIGLQLSILCVGQPSLGRTEVSTLGRLFDEIALKIQAAPVTNQNKTIQTISRYQNVVQPRCCKKWGQAQILQAEMNEGMAEVAGRALPLGSHIHWSQELLVSYILSSRSLRRYEYIRILQTGPSRP